MTTSNDRPGGLTDGWLDQLLEATSEELLAYVSATADPSRTLTAIMADDSNPKAPVQGFRARATARIRRWPWRTALNWTLGIATAAVIAGALAGMGFLLAVSGSSLAVIALLFVIVFISGTTIGIFVIVCWATNREDRQRTLTGTMPDSACAGTRRLNGVSRRDSTPANSRLPDGAGHQSTKRPEPR
jgi:hypothetical protein